MNWATTSIISASCSRLPALALSLGLALPDPPGICPPAARTHLDRDLALLFGQMGGQEPVPGQGAGDVEDPGGPVGQRPGEREGKGAGHSCVPGEVHAQGVNDWWRS